VLVRTVTDPHCHPLEIISIHPLRRVLDVVLYAHSQQLVPHLGQSLRVVRCCPRRTKLVLNLQHFDGAAIGVKVGLDERSQRLEVYLHFLKVQFVGSADDKTIDAEQPGRKPSEVPLPADVGPRPQKHLHLVLHRQL